MFEEIWLKGTAQGQERVGHQNRHLLKFTGSGFISIDGKSAEWAIRRPGTHFVGGS